MNIRHATAADVNTLAFIEAVCFPPAEAADAQAIAARVAAYPAHFWLLEDGGTVVGFVNGMATNMPDLQDEMYDNTGLHTEAGPVADDFWGQHASRIPRAGLRCTPTPAGHRGRRSTGPHPPGANLQGEAHTLLCKVWICR